MSFLPRRMRTALLLILLLGGCFGMLPGGVCRGADSDTPERRIRRYRTMIHVRQRVPHGQVSGVLPPKSVVQAKVAMVYEALSIFPVSFIRASGIKYLTILSRPKLKGEPFAGLASGDTMIISAEDGSPKVVYHELFHIFDEKPQDKRWTKLNDRRFLYTGSVYYPSNLPGRKGRRRQHQIDHKTFERDFASRYAMSNEREDRAETFAFMIVEGKRFHDRTKRSAVMRKKMEYIIQVTRRRLEPGFWEKHLHL